MNVSKRWLHDLVPGLQATSAELAEHLALRGAPVDTISSPGEDIADVVVAKVLSARQHPNADRLSLCEVDGGDGVVQVVCGAPNVRGGTYYPFAPVGAVLPGDFRIKKAKIRGELSQGMLCSSKELGLGREHDGIMELTGEFTPGESFVTAMGLDDATLDVEITANRGDLLSHAGVARELASIGAGSVVLPELPGDPGVSLAYVEGTGEVAAGGVTIRIADPDLCSRYMGAIIRGVKVGPSPEWLQKRLRGAGARPISNVVDATNYVMLELGQPLHAFDLARLAGPGIVVRRSSPSEPRFTTLDGESRALNTNMLMICDAERPVAIGGVMGGLDSEVEDDTTDVLLECALFDPKSIRATRKALNMSTDASYRFERGVDPDGLRTALERCVALIVATAGGTVDAQALDCCPVRFAPSLVDLRLARIEKLLGVAFEADYVNELLHPLGFVVEGSTDGTLHVRVPGYRSYDVKREVDLIEEIARTHGYDAFPSDLGPSRPGSVPDHPMFLLEDELRAAMVGRGLFEAHTPAFAPPGEGDVEVANPLASTEPFMRRSLVPALLRRLAYNLARGNRDVRLFEIGTSFAKAGPGSPPHEETRLAAVLVGRREPPHWSVAEEALGVWDLKALLEDVVGRAYRGSAAVAPGSVAGDTFDAQTTFVVHDASGNAVGHGGRVLGTAVDTPVWASQVWALEVTLPSNVLAAPVASYSALPTVPAVERDLALIIPDAVAAAVAADLIRGSAGEELEALELFDLYRGPAVPEGTRSVAFRLRFRSPERTLKDKEVDRNVTVVLKRLEEELGVKVRG
ncbi:MAG: phenylalanine--tRNA ligase subunit beta [Gemmatimonadetes bacterium]|nr:phenylalanine--tRNA ligase subunit beta [Gemmatimonadota bacterium]MDA1103944.1 phenylalanine--tRNA ligase subunit beta [Gemmatimonadota bacterium]